MSNAFASALEISAKALYTGFFAGFGFVCATGSFTIFDENSPVCGGFGFPRILMTSLQSLFSIQASSAADTAELAHWIPHSTSQMPSTLLAIAMEMPHDRKVSNIPSPFYRATRFGSLASAGRPR
jgi:hypothetical protein